MYYTIERLKSLRRSDIKAAHEILIRSRSARKYAFPSNETKLEYLRLIRMYLDDIRNTNRKIKERA